jgi:hypothetical protein
MIASFAFASRVLGETRYAQAAVKAADFILGSMRSVPAGGGAGDRLLHRWHEGEAGIEGKLDDYAFFIYGLLELYEATFQEKYLDAAQVLAGRLIGSFADQAGGFYMTASDAERLIIRPKEVYDGALPSGNSVAALILLKLYALTQKEIYELQAEALFRSFSSSVAQAPYAHCFLLSALDWHLQGPLEITFKGPMDDPMVDKMLKMLYKHFMPSKAVKYVLTRDPGLVTICARGICKAPIDNVSVFEREILSEMGL